MRDAAPSPIPPAPRASPIQTRGRPMVAQLRPTRLDVTDRFPMLGFTIRTDNPPRAAEVVLATDPALFTRREGRSPSTFYSSREHGLLSVSRGEAVYVVPPDVLARFVTASQLWFGLATATPPAANDWTVDVLPTASSPYVSLSGLTDRSLRRVRMYPARRGGGEAYGGSNAVLEWAGDRAQPGMRPVQQPTQTARPTAPSPAATGPAPADVPYDDGFGPLPPLSSNPPATAAPSPHVEPPATAAQSYSRGLEVDPESMGIEGPAYSEEDVSVSAAAGTLALNAADYAGTTRIAPSPAFNPGRSGQAIDRIVIHITDANTTGSTVSHFTRPDANSSAHYLVAQNGEVIQFVAEADTAWHAMGANRRSIGIEHVAVKQGGASYGSVTLPHLPPSDAEYQASAALVADLCRRYALVPDRQTIIGHNEAHPGTSHTACPNGAWDWDRYMQLVAACYAASLPAPASGQGLGYREPRLRAVSLDAGTISVSSNQQPITAPPVDTVSQLRSIAIQAMLAANPAMMPFVLMARAAAEAGGLAIGIGPSVGAGLLGGAGLGCGLIFAPGNVMGVYGQFEVTAGWIASIGLNLQVTILRGGVSAFSGVSYTAGISGGEGITGGAAALFDGNRAFQGVTLQAGVGAGLSPVDVFTSVQHAVAGQLGFAMAALDPAAAAALDAGGDTVEIKYRAFIPSPIIKGPASDYDPGRIGLPSLIGGEDFGGDGRGFSYDRGSSRAEITATLTLDAAGGISNLRTVNRHWGESTAYDSSYTYHVEGKPDWWLDKQAGLTPSRRSTLQVSDDNLRIYQGAGTTQRSILAMTSNSAVVTIRMAGALPLVWPSPDIDADVSIYLKRGANGVEVMVVGDHDGFPAHELYVNERQIYTYDPVAAGNGPDSLVAPTDREISTSWIAVPSRAGAAAQGLAAPSTARPAARGLDADDWSINWDEVYLVPQPTNMSCWATAAAMIDGWRRRQSVSIDSIAQFDNLSVQNGLPPSSAARFAQAIGFTVHPNACYTPDGFRAIIEANGPVWVAAKVPFLHAIVVTGMYRENGQHYVRITDPWDRVVDAAGRRGDAPPTHVTGSQYIMPYEAFALEFEAAGDTEFAQLLHTGGTHGHTINRGNAAAAGYAQGLSARSDWTRADRYRSGAAAAALDADDWTINWDDVQQIAQPTDMSCWATAAAMVVGWRDRQSVDPTLIARYNGMDSSLTGGLAPEDKRRFADAIGLVVHPNACYTPEGFCQILEANGPIWVTAKVPGVHAIVVTGMYRENGRYFVRITDPWDRVVGTPGAPGPHGAGHSTGSRYIMTYDAFAAEFEAAGDIDRIQLLHSGGTFGNVPNRGSAVSAGYAQGLDAGRNGHAADDDRLGFGTSLTRSVEDKAGVRYDLPALGGIARPANALAGGSGIPPLPGQRVVVDDWPYIAGPSGTTKAGIAIDWQYEDGGVGNITLSPVEPQMLDGWTATIRAEIEPGNPDPNRTELLVRITTTFSRPGDEDQVAVSIVTLGGDGRHQVRHEETPAAPSRGAPAAAQSRRPAFV
ncbi:hypothetical protein ETR14_05090 [Sphingosinicella sp. BN140058]|nr:hypothetical protein ETR14_05090 [Sphingosinicella sp. BN140058]